MPVVPLLGRLRHDDHLSLGVQGPPGQHGTCLSQNKQKESLIGAIATEWKVVGKQNIPTVPKYYSKDY